MAYTNPDTMTEIANILEDLDEEILKDLFKTQILSEDTYTSLPVNHFQPLYYIYKRAMSIDGVEEDDINTIQTRYYNICNFVINTLMDKYQLTIDSNWLSEKYSSIPSLAMALYKFFVLDIFYIMLETLNNYITKNLNDLASVFSDVLQNKDVTTSTNLKTLDPKHAIIASCIYDVTDYAFSMMDSETYFDYIDKKYIPGLLIGELFRKSIITGDFINIFSNVYKENLPLRSKIAFELLYRIKDRGYLQYNSITVHRDALTEENENSDAVNNTDIEDDVD